MQENYIETALGTLPTPTFAAGGVLRYSGIIRSVLAGLRDQGLTAGNWAEVLQVVMMIADLVQTLGPKVEEIIDAIRKALGK